MNLEGSEIFIGGLVVATVIALAVTIWASIEDEKDCRARGGVIHCVTGGGTVIVNGKPGYATSTACDCYWPDGRVMIR